MPGESKSLAWRRDTGWKHQQSTAKCTSRSCPQHPESGHKGQTIAWLVVAQFTRISTCLDYPLAKFTVVNLGEVINIPL